MVVVLTDMTFACLRLSPPASASSLAAAKCRTVLHSDTPRKWPLKECLLLFSSELDQLLLKCISITKYKLHFLKVIQIGLLFSITLAMTGKIQNTFLESN